MSAGNLHADIKKGDGVVTWKPGMASTGNLGGTARTLDGVSGRIALEEGVLSRDGWYLLNDSRSDLFVGDWIQARPKSAANDWYLFGYGTDYHAALRSLFTVSGPPPLPRKYVLGVWYSRYWPYKADEFKQIVQEYQQHDFPLDMLVMDMDWHGMNAKSLGVKRGYMNEVWTGYTWNKDLIPDPVELLQWMNRQGLHVTLNDHPADGIQPNEEMYPDFMRAMARTRHGRHHSFRRRGQALLPRHVLPVQPPAAREGGRRFLVARLAAVQATKSIPISRISRCLITTTFREFETGSASVVQYGGRLGTSAIRSSFPATPPAIGRCSH